jgi:poly(3-hydroxybutyrate) depolymerase
MHKTFGYDFMETIRNTNQWLGATAKSFTSYPAFAITPNPIMNWLAAWGEVTERSFERMVAKPDWNIGSFTCEDGLDHLVDIGIKIKKPFGDLVHFDVQGRKDIHKKVLLVAPMSGHYATLLTSTVQSLLADCEVYITDWHNARDIPVSAGKFDIEDYTKYLIEFIKYLGPDIHVVAVCQPAPLALAATAFISEYEKNCIPKSLILIGGPIDPDANPTEVTDFGRRVTMGQLEHTMIQNVGVKYAGIGRQVYPGSLQLYSFLSMNMDRHSKAFMDQIFRVANGEASDHDKHNKFYDEYLAVMDMPAEFYLSTVERIFKNREIAENKFSVDGVKIDFSKITCVNVMTVEGGKDDISAPGQCYAALELCTGLNENKKSNYVEPDAGHYGIFAGRYWRNKIRPLVLDVMNKN